MRYKKEKAVDPDGWTRWINPIQGYKMVCCDCSLVHDIEWEILKVCETKPDGEWDGEVLPWGEYRLGMRVRRNNRATGQMRRKRKNDR